MASRPTGRNLRNFPQKESYVPNIDATETKKFPGVGTTARGINNTEENGLN
jgi:hypothetical protein